MTSSRLSSAIIACRYMRTTRLGSVEDDVGAPPSRTSPARALSA
ncbi:hypothetical protein [Streptomyces sp. TG1A-8]